MTKPKRKKNGRRKIRMMMERMISAMKGLLKWKMSFYKRV
jgi:hypothetical protein